MCSFKVLTIELLTSAVVWSLFPNSENWPYNCQGLQFHGRVHRTANLGCCMAIFLKSEKWPYNCQGLQFCDKIFTTQKSGHTTSTVSSFGSQLRKLAIELPPLAVLAHKKSSRWDKSQKSGHTTAKVCSCMVTMHTNSEKWP